jgi:WD40 repeat protein
MVSNNIVFGIAGCFVVRLESTTLYLFTYLLIFGFRLEDGVLATYNEHEDSVYSVEWSSADPWTFASLSYDGRLVISKVPRAEKYSILL